LNSSYLNGINRRNLLLGGASAALLGRYRHAFGDVTAADTNSASGETIVIQPSWVLVPDNDKLKVLYDHDVVVSGDHIEEVRPRRSGRNRRIDATGQILLPGFISGHSHAAAGVATRGLIEENPSPVMNTSGRSGRRFLRVMVLMESLSEDELDDLTALNLAEMVRSGCTTQVEMSVSLKQMQSYVRVASKYGIRGYPGGMVPGMTRLLAIWQRTSSKVLIDSVKDTLSEIAANLEYAKSINGSANGRIRPMMAPSVVSVHTPETFAAVKAAAQELGNGIHLHMQAGFNDEDNKRIHDFWGKGEASVVIDQGLISDVRLFGAHLLFLDNLTEDLSNLAKGNFTFAHCPSAAGAGVLASSQPYPEALAAGVNTCVGFDTHSNDYVENMKLAVMQGRARAQLLKNTSKAQLIEPTIWHGLESATRGGAKGLGRDDLGRIQEGAKADLCTIDVTGLLVGNGTMPREPWNNLMYANGLSVSNVMIDGVWKVFGGKLLFGDEADIAMRGGAIVRKLWAQLEKEDFFVPMRS
jgi:cytosine/adenosine deaminase-related metal-dependent hydrolase